jgi:uncharacterized protein DUF2530
MAGKRKLVQPPAVQIDSRRLTLAGTALFFTAFLALLPFYGWLGRHDHRVWLWTCLAGAILGLLGYSLMRRHLR